MNRLLFDLKSATRLFPVAPPVRPHSLTSLLFSGQVLFEQFFERRREANSSMEELCVGARRLPLLLVRHPRARRYLLRLRPDGTARVTIPRGGSLTAARQFVQRHTAWLERQLVRLQTRPRRSDAWRVGMDILFRGQAFRIEAGEPGCIRFGAESLPVSDPAANLRPAIERHLHRLAALELPPQVLELAARHGLSVRRVTVRSQRSRWGSCSRHGTISLNWRLIQTPPFVQKYICIHELLHLSEMNHSPRFWRKVELACPDYASAEQWLKQHSSLLW
jgi:predicted metal-dependent hydrolase